MIDSAPPTRRKFAHSWDEISYLYDKVLYWAYGRKDLRIARKFVRRLHHLLKREDPRGIALLGLSARALIAEITGRLSDAIRYRSREIETLEYLLGLGGGAAHGLDAADISDSLDLLAILYWNSGNLKKAEEILEQSRRYCEKHQVPFDGDDMLAELREERAASNRNGKHVSKAKITK